MWENGIYTDLSKSDDSPFNKGEDKKSCKYGKSYANKYVENLSDEAASKSVKYDEKSCQEDAQGDQ